MDIKKEFSDLIIRLKKKYPDIMEDDILDSVEFAVSLFKRLKNDLSIIIFSSDDRTWIKKCCYEMLDKEFELGIKGGIKSYTENGYSIALDGSTISQSLINEIIPKVGYAI